MKLRKIVTGEVLGPMHLPLHYWLAVLRGLTPGRPMGHRRAKRLLALMLLRGQAERLTFQQGDMLWTVPVWDYHVGRSLFCEGGFQNDDIDALLSWVARHDYLGPQKTTFIDVGANIGTTSLLLARKTGRHIIAVEPAPDNAALLRLNATQNGLDHQITCVQTAVSRAAGQVTLVLDAENSGAGEVWDGARADTGPIAGYVDVPSTPLDELLTRQGVEPSQVAFVWSDTQGYERAVIESGVSLWRAGVPLYVEAWPHALEAHGGIASFLDTAQQHFAKVVVKDDLLRLQADAPLRPIADLARVIDALDRTDASELTDVLLLPPPS